MNDETKAAVEWLREAGGVVNWERAEANADAILAHIDGEPARLAAAREEVRAEAVRIIRAFEGGKYLDLTEEQRVLGLRDSIVAMPLDATPLADENAALRADLEHERKVNARLLAEREAARALNSDLHEIDEALRKENTALRARVAELEADRREAVEALRGLRNEVSARLTGRDSEPGEFERAWRTACAVLKKHPVKP